MFIATLLKVQCIGELLGVLCYFMACWTMLYYLWHLFHLIQMPFVAIWHKDPRGLEYAQCLNRVVKPHYPGLMQQNEELGSASVMCLNALLMLWR